MAWISVQRKFRVKTERHLNRGVDQLESFVNAKVDCISFPNFTTFPFPLFPFPAPIMKPTSYRYEERDEGFQLYLGGVSTIAGLALFPPDADVTQVEYYADAEFDSPSAIEAGFNATIIEHLSKIPTHITVFDFSCSVAPGFAFSTHDDCECHIKAPSKECARGIVGAVASPENFERLWEVLDSNHGSYVVLGAKNQIQRILISTHYSGHGTRKAKSWIETE